MGAPSRVGAQSFFSVLTAMWFKPKTPSEASRNSAMQPPQTQSVLRFARNVVNDPGPVSREPQMRHGASMNFVPLGGLAIKSPPLPQRELVVVEREHGELSIIYFGSYSAIRASLTPNNFAHVAKNT